MASDLALPAPMKACSVDAAELTQSEAIHRDYAVCKKDSSLARLRVFLESP